jgi:hypothetical protein
VGSERGRTLPSAAQERAARPTGKERGEAARSPRRWPKRPANIQVERASRMRGVRLVWRRTLCVDGVWCHLVDAETGVAHATSTLVSRSTRALLAVEATVPPDPRRGPRNASAGSPPTSHLRPARVACGPHSAAINRSSTSRRLVLGRCGPQTGLYDEENEFVRHRRDQDLMAVSGTSQSHTLRSSLRLMSHSSLAGGYAEEVLMGPARFGASRSLSAIWQSARWLSLQVGQVA